MYRFLNTPTGLKLKKFCTPLANLFSETMKAFSNWKVFEPAEATMPVEGVVNVIEGCIRRAKSPLLLQHCRKLIDDYLIAEYPLQKIEKHVERLRKLIADKERILKSLNF